VAEVFKSERSSVIISQGEISFPISSSVFKPQCVKDNWRRKSRPNFELFDPPTVKSGMAGLSKWILWVRPTIKPVTGSLSAV